MSFIYKRFFDPEEQKKQKAYENLDLLKRGQLIEDQHKKVHERIFHHYVNNMIDRWKSHWRNLQIKYGNIWVSFSPKTEEIVILTYRLNFNK